jgi:hypothetical protein
MGSRGLFDTGACKEGSALSSKGRFLLIALELLDWPVGAEEFVDC